MKKALAYSLVGGMLLISALALAVNPPAPHDATRGVTCLGSCHVSHRDALAGSEKFNNTCLSCHRPGDAQGGSKPLALADAANPHAFKGYTAATPKPGYQTSHRWDGFLRNSTAGAGTPTNLAFANVLATSGNNLACFVCHNQHDNTNGKFLRLANSQDQLCVACHAARNTTTAASGSHPIMVGYSVSVRQNPTAFRATPLNANPANPSANLGSFLTSDNKLICSTCHGVHYSDSRSSTVDNAANFTNLSSGDGNLLRTDLKGQITNSTTGDYLNICSNCHQGKFSHNDLVSTTPRRQNVQCTDCHGGHVTDPQEPSVAANISLVRRFMLISSPTGRAGSTKKAYFYNTVQKTFASADSSKPGVCQACHDVPTGSGYPDEHTTLTNCLSCHSHNTDLADGGSFGIAKGCESCHGYPPISNTVGGPTGYAAGSPFTAENSGGHFQHADKSTYAKACVECHKGNTHNTGSFIDVFNKNSNNRLIAGPILALYSSRLQPSYNSSSFTCTNVYCHSDGAPRFTTAGAATTSIALAIIPPWSGGRGTIAGQATECQFCHKMATTPTSRHATHLAGGYSCETCHTNTAGGSTTIKTIKDPSGNLYHVNGLKDVAFSGIAANGQWVAATAQCSALYCHSNGRSATTPVNPATITWNGNAVTCTSCHGDRVSTGNTLSARHYAHLNYTSTGGRPLYCTNCHAATVGSDSTVINTLNHANAKANIKFAASNSIDANGPTYGGTRTSSANGAVVNATAVGETCLNTYCHSNGKGTTSNPPAWGSATTLGCDGCHGSSGKAHPLGTSANSHVQHVESSGFSCDYCHNNTVAQTSILPTKVRYQPFSTHLNGRIDVALKLNGGAIGSYEANKTCANTYCHGNASPIWGATGSLNCTSCHAAANNLPGAHAIHYASSTPASSFRNFSGNVSSLTAYRFTCSSCHDANAASHVNGPGRAAAPVGAAEVAFSAAYRIAGSSAYTYGGSAGVPADNTLAWTNGGTNSCNTTYCHSNGQGSNGLQQVVWSTTVNAGGCSLCHAFSPSSGLSNGHNKHISGSEYGFNCATCHDNTVASVGTAIKDKSKHVNRVKDVAMSATYGGSYSTVCASVYCHSNGQLGNAAAYSSIAWNNAPLNCTSCHGNSLTGAVLSGKHLQHVNNPVPGAIGTNFVCVDCHAKTVSDNTTISSKARHVNKFMDISGVRIRTMSQTQVTNGTCTSYCHSNGKGTPTTPPAWNSAGTLGCNGCHGAGNSNGAPDYTNAGVGNLLANSHSIHATSATDCVRCHRVTTVTGTSIVIGSAKHTDQRIDVRLAKANAFTDYSGVFNPGKTCANTYCHGGTNTSPAWGSSGSITCASCHEAIGTTLPAGHSIHVNTTMPTSYTTAPANTSTAGTYNFTCAACHGSNLSNHANGPVSASSDATIFFGFSSAGRNPAYIRSGTAATDSRGFKYQSGSAGACNATYCHSDGKNGNGSAASLTWVTAQGTIGCNGCHSNASLSSRHLMHINNPVPGDIGSNFGCVDCHAKTVSDNLTVSSKARHVNKFMDISGVRIRTMSQSQVTNGTCTSYCHSNGKGAAGSAVSWTTGPALGCNGCHGTSNSVGSPDNSTPNSHATHALRYGISCQQCHQSTVTTNGTLLGTGIHLNKLHDVNLAVYTAYTSKTTISTGSFATGTCSSTYCHSNGRSRTTVNPNTTAAWGSTPPANCNSCHTNTLVDNTGIGSMSGSHYLHAEIYNFSCTRCHMQTTIDGTSISNTGLHVNGFANVALSVYTSASMAPVLRGTYESSACINAYCHGDGQSLFNPGTGDITWKWDNNATNSRGRGSCSKCHSTLTVSHAKHSSVCTDCHKATATSSVAVTALYHADQNVTIKFNELTLNSAGTVIGLTANTDKVFSKPILNTPSPARCGNLYCHSNVQSGNGTGVFTSTNTPAWDQVNSTNCISCHAFPPITGLHISHITTYGKNCVNCHGYNSPPNSAHANSRINITLPIGITYSRGDAIIPGSGTYGSCSNAASVTGCHNNPSFPTTRTESW